jgi:hypothetical protein
MKIEEQIRHYRALLGALLMLPERLRLAAWRRHKQEIEQHIHELENQIQSTT